MAGRPESHDEFLASLDEPARSCLATLRKNIRAAAPDAEEYIGYGVPAFRQNGALVSYGAAKAHLSFYVQSPAVIEAFADDLTAFRTTKGGINFTPTKPIPATLIKRIVKARLKENELLRGKK
jgi:uncharacterized protein YdhG (YjbR/CyaY superfamily)